MVTLLLCTMPTRHLTSEVPGTFCLLSRRCDNITPDLLSLARDLLSTLYKDNHGRNGLPSHPGGSRNTPSRFMLRKPG